MQKKIAVLIDGGFLRVAARKAKKTYDPDFIEQFAHACKADGEEIFRILYYDCAPFEGTVTLPVSGLSHTFTSNDAWLHDLSHRDLFAVRRGVIKFRGYVPKKKAGPVEMQPFQAKRHSPMMISSRILNKRVLICESV